MEGPLVLAFDVGTQSIRALLVDRQGNSAGTVNKVYDAAYYSRQPNWAEQRAEFYFELLCAASAELKREHPEAFAAAVCTVVTVFRDSYVCLDKTGRPLRDCILWMDQRKAAGGRTAPLLQRMLIRAVGMHDSIELLSRTSMCNWIAENEPEIWERTDKFVLLSTYLNYRLTGELTDSSACQIGHIPFDYKNRCWAEKGLTRCYYDLPQEKLCDIVPSGTVLGAVTAEAAALSGMAEGLPLIATGSDKGCETLGLGVLGRDQAALSFGTSCTVQLTSPRYFEPAPFMPAYPAVPNDLYNGEVQIWRGYWMLTWFKENFASAEVLEAEKLGCTAEELLNRHLGEIPPGCDGLLVLPHWTPGLTTPHARGAMIGFSDVHTRHHVYRAIIEGLNFGLMEGLYGMEKRSGQQVKTLRLGGGGSACEEICQITANMFGLPVERTRSSDPCALGAAMCAFVARGDFASYGEAAESMVQLRDSFRPEEEQHRFYREIYDEVFSKTYKTLRPLHRRLSGLTRRGR